MHKLEDVGVIVNVKDTAKGIGPVCNFFFFFIFPALSCLKTFHKCPQSPLHTDRDFKIYHGHPVSPVSLLIDFSRSDHL